ncbi:universal stress protein [Deinococcus peraridilitoris]|uniref:Universal stress protein UspA-like protein n=1 Tax=Deinococcus peraridilitoris (strain DSM 19664 / LMG 22246 / CIP 109416 / KR-200) TaxID=937777 RepID=L0A589_DEIPD|nr:universal stress protein [Deinococcus peraridilitoris]AFZ69053.1 universal stress protein UspA-like protein [Deinococcus peraridilitoris DSM 19664]
MLQHILVTTDGTALCNSALDQARELALRLDCHLTILHVIPDLEVPVGAADGLPFNYVDECDRHRDACQNIIQSALQRAAGTQADGIVREASGRTIAQVIVEEADALNVDLIVMSTHCRTGISRLLTGSVAETVLHHARQPVLLTHEPSRTTRSKSSRSRQSDSPSPARTS